jgi:hypothetical protein
LIHKDTHRPCPRVRGARGGGAVAVPGGAGHEGSGACRGAGRQGLTLIHDSAQPEPFWPLVRLTPASVSHR